MSRRPSDWWLAVAALAAALAFAPAALQAQSDTQPHESLDPRDAAFGAKGDGVSDDTSSLQAWAAALTAKAGHGTLPCGTFVFRRTLVFGTGVNVFGYGSCAILRYDGEGDAIRVTAVTAQSPTGSAGNDRFEEFQLVRTSGSTAGAGIHMENATDFVLSNLRIHEFYRGILVEGGDAGAIYNPEIRSGTFYKAIVPGSASIAVEPYEYKAGGVAQFACANSLSIISPDIGGNDANYSVEAGLKITCVDGLYMGTGHIGAVQNDVEITRIAGRRMNAQSIEIDGYLDGSRRAVYVAPPFGGTGPGGADTSGGGTAHLRLKPFQIDNQFGNAIEIDDPTADVGVSDVDFAHVAGWGVYAPHVYKLSVLGSKFETIGYKQRGSGGISVGIVDAGKTAGIGARGSVAAVMIAGNQFYGIEACIFVASANEALVQGNLVHDCKTGRPREPPGAFP